jgi:flagellar FliL protein
VGAALLLRPSGEEKKGKGKGKEKAAQADKEHEEGEEEEDESEEEHGEAKEEKGEEEHGEAAEGEQAEEGGEHDGGGVNCPHEEAGGHGGAKKGPTDTFPLEPFIVNLSGDGSEVKFLKVTVKLKLAKAECTPFVEPHMAEMRDSILMLLSSKEYDMIKSVQGKMELRDEILERVKNIEKHGRIKSAFFTDFVAQ